MRPVIDPRTAAAFGLAGCIGLGVGALAWLMFPSTPDDVALPGRSPRPPPAATARFGELLIAPLTFAGSDVMVQPTLPTGPVVNTGTAGEVRLLGVSRSGRGSRALLALPDGKSLWIRRGACVDSLCVTAVGSSSVVLETGGQSRRIDLFDQRRTSGPGANANPSPVLAQPPPPESGPQPGGVEPKSAPPGSTSQN